MFQSAALNRLSAEERSSDVDSAIILCSFEHLRERGRERERERGREGVRERESEGGREGGRERERGREREGERERERLSRPSSSRPAGAADHVP